jgi:hypothetical protein
VTCHVYVYMYMHTYVHVHVCVWVCVCVCACSGPLSSPHQQGEYAAVATKKKTRHPPLQKKTYMCTDKW